MRFAVKLLMSFVFLSLPAFAGGVDPFPFGKEIKFPWKTIPGIWQIEDGNSENLFSFKTKTNSKGEKEMDIMLINPTSCYLIAHGKGILNGKFVAAQMISHDGAFNITIHAFNSSDVSRAHFETNMNTLLRSEASNDKVVMALTVFPIGEWDQRSTFQITKVGTPATPLCW